MFVGKIQNEDMNLHIQLLLQTNVMMIHIGV